MSGQTIALSLFLVLVAIGTIILIGIFIVIKRSIARRKSRIGRIVYTSVGSGAPKVWILKLDVETYLVLETVNKLSDKFDSKGNLGFQFRAKTVDLFIDLTPPVRSIRDFLMSACSEAMLPKPNQELVESYCELYNRARHDPGAYTDVDYLKFLEIHDQLLKAVVVKADIPIAIDSPNKSSSLRVHKRRSKTCSSTRPGGHQGVVTSSSLEFIKMKKAVQVEATPGTSGVVDNALLRTALSRSGSAASDDSQTALIRLDHYSTNIRTA
nr:NICE 3 family protein [Hymenolepis microstoma]